MTSKSAKNAIMLGTVCSLAYLAIYVVRNILSPVTPHMIAAGYGEAYIGLISSVFLAFYAIGQLLNGAIGDKIKAKWMISIGLTGAGITNFLFVQLLAYPVAAILIYGLTGYFLSMIYGPMTKVVSENTEPLLATRCTLGYTFSSLLGSPAAGLLALFLTWQSVFVAGSITLLVMSITVFAVFVSFERRDIIKYGQYKPKEKGAKNIKILFKHHIVKFSIISLLTGVVRTSVVFWLPTYLEKHLSFNSTVATTIFTVASFIISLTAFIAVFVYERLGHDIDKTVLLMFICAALFFTLTYFVSQSVLNTVFIVLAIMSSNGAACMLFSRYCPSLRDTGMVSSVTGFIDFLSYMAAAVANIAFANAANTIGWGNLILIWLALMVIGIAISLPYGKIKEKFKRTEA